MTHRIQRRAGGVLALTVTMLALTSTAVPASARTYDINSIGSMVQQPLPPGFACAMRRAVVNRRISCRGIYAAGGGVTAGVPLASPHRRPVVTARRVAQHHPNRS